MRAYQSKTWIILERKYILFFFFFHLIHVVNASFMPESWSTKMNGAWLCLLRYFLLQNEPSA